MAISFGRRGTGGSGGVQAVFVESHQSGTASPSNATWTGLDTHTPAWQIGDRDSGKVAVNFGVTTTATWTSGTSSDVDYQVRVMGRTSANATGPWTSEVPLQIVAGGDIAYRSTQHTSSDTTTRKNLAAYVPFALSDLPNTADFANGRYVQFGLSVAIDGSPSPNSITVEDSYLSFTSFGDGFGVPPDEFITTAKIADGAVTRPKIADNAVDSTKIANGGVGSAQIATGGVATGNLADGSVTSQKIAAGGVASGNIENAAVTNPKIADGSISTAKLQDGSVTSAKLHSSFAYDIPDGGVTTIKLANGAVTSDKIAGGAVGEDELAVGAVGNDELANGAVDSSKIASGGVRSDNIADGSVGTAKISNDAVTGAKIASGAIVPDKLQGISASQDAGKGIVVNSDGSGFVAVEGGAGGAITSVQPEDLDGVTGGSGDASKFIKTDSTGDEFTAKSTIDPTDLGLGADNSGKVIAVNNNGGGFQALENITPSDLGLDEGLDQAGRIVGYDAQGTGFLAVNAADAGAAPTLENITGVLNVAKGGTGISATSLADLRTKLGIASGPTTASLLLATNADTQQDKTIERTDSSTASVPTGVADGVIIRVGNDQWLLDIESGKQWARTLTDNNDGVWTSPVAATLPRLQTESDFRTLGEDDRGWTDTDAWLPSFSDGSKPSKVIVARNGDYLVAIDRFNTFWSPRPVVGTWASIPWRWEGTSTIPSGLYFTGGENDEERIPAGTDAIIGGKTGIDGEEYITLLVNHELASGVSTYTGYFIDDDADKTIRSATNTRGYITGTWARVKADIDGISDDIIIENRQDNSPVFLGITPATDQFELTGYSFILSGEVALSNVLWNATDRTLQIHPKAEDAHFGSMMRRGAQIEIHKTDTDYIRGVVEYYHAVNTDITLARLRQSDMESVGSIAQNDTVSIRAWGSAILKSDTIGPANLGLPVGLDQAGKAVGFDSTGTYFLPIEAGGGGGGGSLTNGSVLARHLAANSVITSKIANNAVTQAKLAANSVGSSQLIDGSVGTAALADDSVTPDKMAGITTGSGAGGYAIALNSAGTAFESKEFPSSGGVDLTDGSVTTAKLDSDAVTNAKLADDAVQTENIADDAITNALIADDAVDTAQIADDAITSALIADDAVGSDQIADNAVDSDRLKDHAVTLDKISTDIMVPDTDAGGTERAAFVGVVPAISDLHFSGYTFKTSLTNFNEGDVYYDSTSRTCYVRHKTADIHLPDLFAIDYEVSLYKDDSNQIRGVFDTVRNFDLPGGVTLTGAIFRADDIDISGTIAVGDTVAIRGHKAVLTRTEVIPPISLGITHSASISGDAVIMNSTGDGFTTGTVSGTPADGSITTAKLADDALTPAKMGGITTGADASGYAIALNSAGTAFESKPFPAAGGGSIPADLSVTTGKLAADAVTNAKLADDAVQTENIADDAITNALIADGAVDTDQLAADAVTGAKIDDGAVGTDQLAADAVTQAKIADDAVGSDQIIDGAVNTNRLAADAVTNAKLADDAVETANIADDAITNALIADGAVDTAQLAADAVTSAKIEDGAVDTEHLAADAVTPVKVDGITTGADEAGKAVVLNSAGTGFTTELISSGSGTPADDSITSAMLKSNIVTNAKMADDSVGASELIDDSVGNAAMADDAIDTAQLADGAVDTDRLANNAVTNAKMADDSVGASELIDDSVGNAAMADNAIDTAQIAADAVTGAKIADDAVNTEHLADDAVEAAQIASGAVGSDALASNAVTGAKIASGAVGTDEIADDAVTQAKIAANSISPTEVAGVSPSVSLDGHALVFNSQGTGFTTAVLPSGSGGADVPHGRVYLAETDGTDDTNTYTSAGDRTINESDVTTAFKMANRSAAGGTFYFNGKVQHNSTHDQRIKAKMQARWASTSSGVTSATNWADCDVFNGGAQFMDESVTSANRNIDQDFSLALPFNFSDLPSGAADNQWVQFRVVWTLSANSVNAQSTITWTLRGGRYYGISLSGGGAEIGTGSIGTDELADDAVTNAKLADDSVGAEHLIDDSVGNAAMADNAIDTAQLAANAVTGAKIEAGAVDTDQLASDAVTGAKIADDAVGSDQIADASVNSDKLTANAVTNAKLSNGAVDTNQLAADAVTGAKIADDAVDTEHLADDAVEAAQVADGAIGTAALADDAVTPDKVGGLTVGSGAGDYAIALNSAGTAFVSKAFPSTTPADGSITHAKLAANAVESDNIAADAVTQSALADDSVGADQLIDDSVGAAAIADGAVATAALADDALTPAKMAGITTGSGAGGYAVALNSAGTAFETKAFPEGSGGSGGGNTIIYSPYVAPFSPTAVDTSTNRLTLSATDYDALTNNQLIFISNLGGYTQDQYSSSYTFIVCRVVKNGSNQISLQIFRNYIRNVGLSGNGAASDMVIYPTGMFYTYISGSTSGNHTFTGLESDAWQLSGKSTKYFKLEYSESGANVSHTNFDTAPMQLQVGYSSTENGVYTWADVELNESYSDNVFNQRAYTAGSGATRGTTQYSVPLTFEIINPLSILPTAITDDNYIKFRLASTIPTNSSQRWALSPQYSITILDELGVTTGGGGGGGSNTIADGSITTAKLAADAITNAKIADDAVDTENIADDAITAALIDDGAVGTSALAADAVVPSKVDGINTGADEADKFVKMNAAGTGFTLGTGGGGGSGASSIGELESIYEETGGAYTYAGYNQSTLTDGQITYVSNQTNQTGQIAIDFRSADSAVETYLSNTANNGNIVTLWKDNANYRMIRQTGTQSSGSTLAVNGSLVSEVGTIGVNDTVKLLYGSATALNGVVKTEPDGTFTTGRPDIRLGDFESVYERLEGPYEFVSGNPTEAGEVSSSVGSVRIYLQSADTGFSMGSGGTIVIKENSSDDFIETRTTSTTNILGFAQISGFQGIRRGNIPTNNTPVTIYYARQLVRPSVPLSFQPDGSVAASEIGRTALGFPNVGDNNNLVAISGNTTSDSLVTVPQASVGLIKASLLMKQEVTGSNEKLVTNDAGNDANRTPLDTQTGTWVMANKATDYLQLNGGGLCYFGTPTAQPICMDIAVWVRWRTPSANESFQSWSYNNARVTEVNLGSDRLMIVKLYAGNSAGTAHVDCAAGSGWKGIKMSDLPSDIADGDEVQFTLAFRKQSPSPNFTARRWFLRADVLDGGRVYANY